MGLAKTKHFTHFEAKKRSIPTIMKIYNVEFNKYIKLLENKLATPEGTLTTHNPSVENFKFC